MKYAPQILSGLCLIGGVVCVALGEKDGAMLLLGAFVGQFAPSAVPPKAEPEDAP